MTSRFSTDRPAEEPRPPVAVGDRVVYLPAPHYALQQGHGGELPWVLGRQNPQRGDVEELAGDRLAEALLSLKRSPNPAEERRRLVLVRPNRPWPAVVTAVAPDGSVSLDVEVGNGCTLHETGVKPDPTRTQPHTYHLVNT
jgi:hypothetical protein